MKNTLILLISLFFISCSNLDEEQIVSDKSEIIEITEFSQIRVRIGDTLIIKGKNLDFVTSINLTYPDDYDDDEKIAVNPLEKKTELIKVIIPTLNYENFILTTFENSTIINSTPLNLIGTFPLKFNATSDDIGKVKMVNDKTAFLVARNKLYKTTDGGYNWQMIKEFEFYIRPMFFIDENKGWVGIQDNSNFMLYFTEDGGNTFNKIFEGARYSTNIVDMQFSSSTNGYLLGYNGEIYHTSDNRNFNLIYNSSTSTAGNSFSFRNLSVFDNSLIASGENVSIGKSILLQGVNNDFNYAVFHTYIWDIQQLNESQAFISNNVNENYNHEENVFFRSNIGANWEKTGNKFIKYFHFLDKNKGIGINYATQSSRDHSVVFETYDGGKNWINQFDFKDFEYSIDIDFYNNSGFITGYRGKVWKHILE